MTIICHACKGINGPMEWCPTHRGMVCPKCVIGNRAVKIEINDSEGVKSDLMLVRHALRESGLPVELRAPISFLISKIQKAQNELLEGETK